MITIYHVSPQCHFVCYFGCSLVFYSLVFFQRGGAVEEIFWKLICFVMASQSKIYFLLDTKYDNQFNIDQKYIFSIYIFWLAKKPFPFSIYFRKPAVPCQVEGWGGTARCWFKSGKAEYCFGDILTCAHYIDGYPSPPPLCIFKRNCIMFWQSIWS